MATGIKIHSDVKNTIRKILFAIFEKGTIIRSSKIVMGEYKKYYEKDNKF